MGFNFIRYEPLETRKVILGQAILIIELFPDISNSLTGRETEKNWNLEICIVHGFSKAYSEN